MGHPLAIALDAAGMSKADLVEAIKRGKFKRDNGKRIHLSIRYIDQMLCVDSNHWRSPHKSLARAIAAVLKKDETWAGRLMLWTPTESRSAA